MTKVTNTTMVSSEAANSSFKMVVHHNKSKGLKAVPEQKITVKRTHSFTIHAYFPSLLAKTKFNPIASMQAILVKLLKHEPLITIVNTTTKMSKQLTSIKQSRIQELLFDFHRHPCCYKPAMHHYWVLHAQ